MSRLQLKPPSFYRTCSLYSKANNRPVQLHSWCFSVSRVVNNGDVCLLSASFTESFFFFVTDSDWLHSLLSAPPAARQEVDSCSLSIGPSVQYFDSRLLIKAGMKLDIVILQAEFSNVCVSLRGLLCLSQLARRIMINKTDLIGLLQVCYL